MVLRVVVAERPGGGQPLDADHQLDQDAEQEQEGLEKGKTMLNVL